MSDAHVLTKGYLHNEAEWITNKIKGFLNAGVHPSEIIILVQRAVAAKPILQALRASEVPAKSYYEESQLDSEAAQMRFALYKLFLNNDDRVALRYLLGSDVDDFRCNAYGRVRKHCESSGDSPWQAMNMLADKALIIAHSKPLLARFKLLTEELAQLDAVKADVQAFVDRLLPDGDGELAELRSLALVQIQIEGAKTPADLLAGMMREITQPDIPPTVEEVRLMSLHKSKGLSSPYVFVAGCVEGILPPAFHADWSKDEKDAALEEARRLFYVGITRVKADPDSGRPGSLFISYPQQMTVKDAYGANIAFRTQSGAMANLLPSRFLNELGPAAPKPISG